VPVVWIYIYLHSCIGFIHFCVMEGLNVFISESSVSVILTGVFEIHAISNLHIFSFAVTFILVLSSHTQFT